LTASLRRLVLEARSGSRTDYLFGNLAVRVAEKREDRRATKEAWALAPQAFMAVGMRVQLFCCYLDYLHSLLFCDCVELLFLSAPTRKSNYTQGPGVCQGKSGQFSTNF
jgi:hypothetical protein